MLAFLKRYRLADAITGIFFQFNRHALLLELGVSPQLAMIRFAWQRYRTCRLLSCSGVNGALFEWLAQGRFWCAGKGHKTAKFSAKYRVLGFEIIILSLLN